ncbi:MAG: CoA-transferase [Microthrixaceae bacterium]
MANKVTTAAEATSHITSGMTIGIGGWGARRKPMALIAELVARADLSDLTLVAYGGPEVGILCRAGKVAKVISGFVSLDTIPLEPHYRAARQAGTIDAAEWDEGMLLLGLNAAGWNLPFLPTRAGLGSDVPRVMADLKTVTSPYPGRHGGEPEELMAVPALHLDVALIHANRADAAGNAQLLGEDPFMDDLFVRAADRAIVSCERVVEPSQFLEEGPVQTLLVSRLNTDAVVEAPGGAGFTQCLPDYERDEDAQREYARTAKSDEAWDEWLAGFIAQPSRLMSQEATR